MIGICILLLSLTLLTNTAFGIDCSCESHLTENGKNVPQEDMHRKIHDHGPEIFTNQDDIFRLGSECISKPTCDTSKLKTPGQMKATCVKIAVDASGEFQGHEYEVKGTYRDCIVVNELATEIMDNRCMSHTLADGYHSLDICLCADTDNCNGAINKQLSIILLVSSILLVLVT